MPATVNHCHPIHQGRVFSLFRENVTLENGVTVDMDLIRHPGASAVIPLTEAKDIVMIRQYRHAVGAYIWEIPAGTLDPRETPLDCAKRELTEETGFAASQWQPLGEVTPVPGYSNERIHLFLATQLTQATQRLDSDEMLHVETLAMADAVNMVFQGGIQDCKTICGILLANHLLDEKGTRPPWSPFESR
jgi:ADP-ribose pyrophosphatase